MTGLNNKSQPRKGFSFSTILRAGLIAGTLDILSAFVYYYLKTKKNPLNVLTYVSKTALGQDRFSSIAVQQVSGLLVHFCIAFCWTIVFFLLYPRIKFLRLNKFITAFVYGVFVWTMMNLVIVPAWINKAFVYKADKLESMIINCMILIFAIGAPLAFIASSQYSKKD